LLHFCELVDKGSAKYNHIAVVIIWEQVPRYEQYQPNCYWV